MLTGDEKSGKVKYKNCFSTSKRFDGQFGTSPPCSFAVTPNHLGVFLFFCKLCYNKTIMIRWILILLVLGAIVAAFVPSTTTIFTLLLFIAIFFLARNLDFGLILLVFFFPYLGLVIDFSAFEIFREAPYLRSINAPFIDLYGLMLFAAWGLHIIKNAKFKIKNENTDKILHFPFSILNSLPHWRSYLLFWFSGLISLMRVPSIQLDTSIKYFLRPFTFFYLVFFAPVVSILTKIHNPTSSPSPGLRPSSPAGRGASKHFPSPSGRGEGEGGLFTDTARTVIVGKVDKKVRELVKVTEKALKIGIKQVRAGRRVSHIAKAVEKYIEKFGFGIVRDLVGHGVGYKVHEPPEVPNFWEEGFPDCVLEEGMVIAIEPMVNLGGWRVKVQPDGWTIVTVDGKPSAHFEHTVIVRKRGAEIVTK